MKRRQGKRNPSFVVHQFENKKINDTESDCYDSLTGWVVFLKTNKRWDVSSVKVRAGRPGNRHTSITLKVALSYRSKLRL